MSGNLDTFGQIAETGYNMRCAKTSGAMNVNNIVTIVGNALDNSPVS